jgi:hyaluronoglucosaminidase
MGWLDATNRPGRPIKVGKDPSALAITPDGRTVYVEGQFAAGVTPISTATNRPGKLIKVGGAIDLAITPDGKTLYVPHFKRGTITPVTISTGHVGRLIKVGAETYAIVIAPSGLPG